MCAGLERQVAQYQQKNLLPTTICKRSFSTLFNLLIIRVTRTRTNHRSNNSLARSTSKLISQSSSEDMLSGVKGKVRGCRGNSYHSGTAQGMEALVLSFLQHRHILSERQNRGTFQKIII